MSLLRGTLESKRMSDALMIVGFLVVWLALQYVILPRLGVGT